MSKAKRVTIYTHDKGIVRGQEALFIAYILSEMRELKKIHRRWMKDKAYAKVYRDKTMARPDYK